MRRLKLSLCRLPKAASFLCQAGRLLLAPRRTRCSGPVSLCLVGYCLIIAPLGLGVVMTSLTVLRLCPVLVTHLLGLFSTLGKHLRRGAVVCHLGHLLYFLPTGLLPARFTIWILRQCLHTAPKSPTEGLYVYVRWQWMHRLYIGRALIRRHHPSLLPLHR